MLTKEEIKNLRIGDYVFIFNHGRIISELNKTEIHFEESASSLEWIHNDSDDLFLIPPKKKKKFWKWAYKNHESELVKESSFFYDDKLNRNDTGGGDFLKKTPWKQKLENVFIEVEV